MVECCEAIGRDETDCSHMSLIGGNMGTLLPRGTRNITLIYPNLYPYGRKGQCVILLQLKNTCNQTSEMKKKILFDTSVDPKHPPPELMENGQTFELPICSSKDQDPFRSCRPVNCHMKYSGKRTFYSHPRRKCLPAPVCLPSCGKKEMPSLIYVAMSNTCRDLESPVAEGDMRFLTVPEEKEYPSDPSCATRDRHANFLGTILDCHHGRLSRETGTCDCEPGWASLGIDPNQVVSSTIPLHMCNIRDSCLTADLEVIKERMNQLCDQGVILTVSVLLIFIVPFSCFTSMRWSKLKRLYVHTVQSKKRLKKVGSSVTPSFYKGSKTCNRRVTKEGVEGQGRGRKRPRGECEKKGTGRGKGTKKKRSRRNSSSRKGKGGGGGKKGGDRSRCKGGSRRSKDESHQRRPRLPPQEREEGRRRGTPPQRPTNSPGQGGPKKCLNRERKEKADKLGCQLEEDDEKEIARKKGEKKAREEEPRQKENEKVKCRPPKQKIVHQRDKKKRPPTPPCRPPPC